jgi:hypothetical protein
MDSEIRKVRILTGLDDELNLFNFIQCFGLTKWGKGGITFFPMMQIIKERINAGSL